MLEEFAIHPIGNATQRHSEFLVTLLKELSLRSLTWLAGGPSNEKKIIVLHLPQYK